MNVLYGNRSIYLPTVCMYVCIEVALRGDAHGIGRSNLAKGGGPIGIVGPISQPHGTNGTASLTLDHTYALNVRFLSQLYFRQLRVSCVLM